MERRPETPLTPEVRAIEGKYKRDVAIVTARPRVETAFFVVWGAIDIILLLFFVLVIVMYLVSGSFVDARLTRTLVDNAPALRAANVRAAVSPLVVEDAKIIALSGGRYDIFADIENPNDAWSVTFDYHYQFGATSTEIMEGSLNPREERSFPVLNVENSSRPSGARLVIANEVWKRVDAHQIPDLDAFLREHDNFTLDTSVYANDVVIGTERVARSTLTITNRTAYAYWDPIFIVKLLRGSTVIGITQVTVPEFGAGQTRTIDVHWFGDFPATATVAVEPMINYFDRAAYMNPDSEVPLDVRR